MLRATLSWLPFVVLLSFVTNSRAEVRIKDVTSIEGARGNQLYGLGLVVGLNNTGARSLATQQQAIDMLRRMEVTTKIARQSLLDNVYKASSIAMVIVTTEIPEFARKGSRLDVVVSVADDASSLEGGTLILTPLRGADGEVYAVAQGQVSIGGFRVRGAGNSGQLNHPTAGRIPNGAIVEREALGQIHQNGIVRLLLREPDFATASAITKAINERFAHVAATIDAGTVQLRIPLEKSRHVPEFVSEVGLLPILPDTPARVIINERTGTVIVGNHVRVSAVAIAHGNLVIKPNTAVIPPPGSPTPLPNPPPLVSPPKESDEGRLPLPPAPQHFEDKPQTFVRVEQTYTVAELARILNALGVSPRDLIAIFQALKQSGALHAELVIM